MCRSFLQVLLQKFMRVKFFLFFNLIFICASAQNPPLLPSENYVLNSIQNSLSMISRQNQVSYFFIEPPQHLIPDSSFLRAPNSYIFDVDLAEQNHYSGLKIPVKKAFEIWENEDWFLNEPLNENGTLSAYVYWEDTHGLISSVEIENANPIENSKISVLINPKKGKGNALISLHLGDNGNENDPIIWSWHIWVTDDPTEGTTYGQGIETDKEGNLFEPKYMDRNLGAVHDHIMGHDWHKTTGLFYEWGRKDPIPSFTTKDFGFHELNGLVGYMRNREGTHQGNILPEVTRPFEDISSNLKFSIQNPIAYLLNADSGTWFSSQQYRIPDDPDTDPIETVTWDLWSDNMRGENSNASSSDEQIRNDSRSYELKSPYDPCPHGWRVPSHMGRVTTNNNHSPWGRKNSGANDDINPDYSIFYPHQSNEVILDVKVYPGLGIDFTNAHTTNSDSRNLGLMPTSGYYVSYFDNDGNPSVVFQDTAAVSNLWTATYSLGGARYLRVITDPLRYDVSDYGLNQIFINETTYSMEALPVRCMQDPNLNLTGNFETEYIISNKNYFTQGLYNPNSYVILNESELLIPLNKAFSVHEYLFPQDEGLASDHLIANVYWTDNPSLIQTIVIEGNSDDVRENFIHLTFNAGQHGNAVVSLHNGSLNNPVYWSWHIWAVADEIQEITYGNQEILPAEYNLINATSTSEPPLTTTFMDRNLGAVYDLPVEIIDHPDNQQLLNEVKYSGGFHYQWGRKDPIPSFRFVENPEFYEIFKGISIADGIVSYQIIDAVDYQNQFTEQFSDYSNEAGVQPGDPKYIAAEKIIDYSVRHPLTFLHHGTTSASDWIDDELSTFQERWGHGSRKSVFDPCPQGWRVPDTFKVYENGKGSSPWYNGKKLGSNQGFPNYIGSHYGGEFFSLNNHSVGWYFTDPDYQIGYFPATGIIGKFSPSEVGGLNPNQAITGIWTAAMTQQMKGYALAMTMGILTDSDHRVISAGNISPAYGLNVRCAKDERRYTGDLGNDYFELNIRDFDNLNSNNEIRVFPNPVGDFLHVSSDKNYQINIYDTTGRLIRKTNFENKKINVSDLGKGIYIGLITNPDTLKTIAIKIIKL